MPNVNTKQPTGLSIARDGWKYTLSWKIADANYGQGQTLQYRLSTASKTWVSLSVGATATSKALTLSASRFYPTTTKKLTWVEFRLCGRRSNTLFTASASFSSETLPVPNVSTRTETGRATPMA